MAATVRKNGARWPGASIYLPKIDELRDILLDCDAQHRLMYMAMLSSGTSLLEAIRLRKSDIISGMERPMARIPGRSGNGRLVAFSIEVMEPLTRLIEGIGDDDLVFMGVGGRPTSVQYETAYLRRRVRNVWLDRPSGGGRFTATSFQLFFIQQVGQHNEFIAMHLVGRGGLLKRPMKPKDLLAYYREFEGGLLIFDQAKNESEIRMLRKELEGVTQIAEDNARMCDIQNKDLNRRVRMIEKAMGRP